MDAIKRDRANLFWSEWEAVTERTRNLLKRYADHCIFFTVNPVLLKDAMHQQDERNKRKKAADRANSQDRQKVERVQTFPPLIIP